MLNVLWPLFIIISCGFAIFSGKISDVNNSIFESTKQAVEITVSMVGTICLWNGIMAIAKETSLVKKIEKILKPIIKWLFPDSEKNEKIRENITMNIISNIMGLGNAATPVGLKAMEEMQKNNKEKNKLSNSMALFIVLNTASIQIVPTTVIAIRNSLNSSNPGIIVFPVWVATICAAVSAIATAKIIIKKNKG